MATVHDVAAYVLEKTRPMTSMKLEKLVYYSQAWHLVWEDEPLFDERIEAWANGPVAPDLYREHRGQFTLTSLPKGSASNLTEREWSSIDSVVGFYGDKSAQYLSALTHREAPWADAREGLAAGVRSHWEITPAAMAEFYGSLV